MVNNYPEYAAGVNYKKTDTNGNRHFYSAQVVADPANETVESKLIKDGVVIDEGGSSVTVEALSVTENGTYSEEGKAYSPVVVNVPAPASDFTTAKVKFISNSATNKIYYVNVIEPDETTGVEMHEEQGGREELAEERTVILYKGKYVLPWNNFNGISEETMPTATGDITLDLSAGFIIEGDGTITCEGTETPQ